MTHEEQNARFRFALEAIAAIKMQPEYLSSTADLAHAVAIARLALVLPSPDVPPTTKQQPRTPLREPGLPAGGPAPVPAEPARPGPVRADEQQPAGGRGDGLRVEREGKNEGEVDPGVCIDCGGPLVPCDCRAGCVGKMCANGCEDGERPRAPKVSIRTDGVFLVRNGKERKLRSAQRVTVEYEEVEPTVARVEFWEPGFDGTIQVSEVMAAALLSADGQRQIAFLTDEDAKELRGLSDSLARIGDPGAASLRKIIQILDERDEIPF